MASNADNWKTLCADCFGTLRTGDSARGLIVLGSVVEYSGVFSDGADAGEVLA